MSRQGGQPPIVSDDAVDRDAVDRGGGPDTATNGGPGHVEIHSTAEPTDLDDEPHIFRGLE